MKTQNNTELKPASFGSVSTGTLRTIDLLNAFHSALEGLVFVNGDFLSRPENFATRDRFAAILGEAQDCFDADGEDIDSEKQDIADELVNETLVDALSEFAPAYGYFGSLEGDGADFGFWVNIDDVKEQVGFVSSKAQEYPDDDFRGEWLRVSDHGNCTLYSREERTGIFKTADGDAFIDFEIWSIV